MCKETTCMILSCFPCSQCSNRAMKKQALKWAPQSTLPIKRHTLHVSPTSAAQRVALLMSGEQRDHLTVTDFRTRPPGTHFTSKQRVKAHSSLVRQRSTTSNCFSKRKTRLSTAIPKHQCYIHWNWLGFPVVFNYSNHDTKSQFQQLSKKMGRRVQWLSHPNIFWTLVKQILLLINYAVWEVVQTSGIQYKPFCKTTR